jgi:hypothetical protein
MAFAKLGVSLDVQTYCVPILSILVSNFHLSAVISIIELVFLHILTQCLKFLCVLHKGLSIPSSGIYTFAGKGSWYAYKQKWIIFFTVYKVYLL